MGEVEDGLCDLALVKMHHMVNMFPFVLKFGFQHRRVGLFNLGWDLDIMACISFNCLQESDDGPTTSGEGPTPSIGNRRRSFASDSEAEAEEDRNLLLDDDLPNEEEEEGEDLYPDNFMEQ